MHPFGFLSLVFVLSVPFYLAAWACPLAILPVGLPIVALMVVVPAGVACAMTAAAGGRVGLLGLWHRVLRPPRPLGWVWPALMIMPMATALGFGLMRGLASPLPDRISFAISDFPGLVLLFGLGAVLEEIGWTSYATEALLPRWGALRSGLCLGVIWALWHVPAWAGLQSHPLPWVMGQIALCVLARVIMVRLYLKAGRSLILPVLFHLMINLSFAFFPNSGSHYDPVLICVALFGIGVPFLLWIEPA